MPAFAVSHFLCKYSNAIGPPTKTTPFPVLTIDAFPLLIKSITYSERDRRKAQLKAMNASIVGE